jgi:hypothetical protein
MAQTAVCNRHHTVDQQLCRWLLLSLDRLPTERAEMTQELIANMLGVRREGVTEAAGKLQGAGLINYSRGHITVLDRPWAGSARVRVLRGGPGDGFLYLGGLFDNVAGVARARVARLSLTTGASDPWNAALASTLSGFEVTSMATDGSHLYLSGAFDSVQGQQRRRLAKVGLDAAATLDPAWAPQVLSAPTQFSGPRLLQVIGAHVYAGDTVGDHLLSSDGAQKSARLLRLSRTGNATLDLAFDPFADVTGTSANGPRAIVTGDGGGRLFVGGAVSELSAGEIRLGLAALNANGSVDTLSALSEARRVAGVGQLAFDSSDGSLYVQGNFLRVNGVLRFGLVRLLPSGAVDGGFRPPAGRYSAVALAGGAVFAADDKARVLRKLDPVSGDPVAGFVPIAYTQSVNQLLASSAHLYLLGSFQLSGIAPSLGRFARIDLASGTVDTAFRFTPNAGGSLSGLALDPAGSSLFLFGQFSSLNGQALQNLARIDLITHSLDTGFAPAIPTSLTSAVADGSGGLWLSGGFTTINGTACRAPARLLITSASLDPAFSCVRTPIGTGSLTFAADAIHGVFSNSLRRFRYADGGSPDPNWLERALRAKGLSAIANRARGRSYERPRRHIRRRSVLCARKGFPRSPIAPEGAPTKGRAATSVAGARSARERLSAIANRARGRSYERPCRHIRRRSALCARKDFPRSPIAPEGAPTGWPSGCRPDRRWESNRSRRCSAAHPRHR